MACADVDRPAEGAVHGIVEHLLAKGHVFPGRPTGDAMFRKQSGRMAGHIDRVLPALISCTTSIFHNVAAFEAFGLAYSTFANVTMYTVSNMYRQGHIIASALVARMFNKLSLKDI